MKYIHPESVLLTLTLIASATLAPMVHAADADEDKWNIDKIDVSKLPPPDQKQGLTYAKDIRPIFESSCLRCHGEERPRGDLRLDTLEGVLKGGKDGKVIIPGDSKKSLLAAAAAQVNDEIAMPPKRRPRGPGGPGGPGGPRPPGPRSASADQAPPGNGPGPGNRPPGGGPRGPGGPAGPGGFGPPPKPMTPEQVSLVRAWIDQGAK